MTKIIEIESCWFCRDIRTDYASPIYWCGRKKGKMKVNIKTIPTWCPLPDKRIDIPKMEGE